MGPILNLPNWGNLVNHHYPSARCLMWVLIFTTMKISFIPEIQAANANCLCGIVICTSVVYSLVYVHVCWEKMRFNFLYFCFPFTIKVITHTISQIFCKYLTSSNILIITISVVHFPVCMCMCMHIIWLCDTVLCVVKDALLYFHFWMQLFPPS